MVIIVMMGLGVRVVENLHVFLFFCFFCSSFIFWFLYFIRLLLDYPGVRIIIIIIIKYNPLFLCLSLFVYKSISRKFILFYSIHIPFFLSPLVIHFAASRSPSHRWNNIFSNIFPYHLTLRWLHFHFIVIHTWVNDKQIFHRNDYIWENFHYYCW